MAADFNGGMDGREGEIRSSELLKIVFLTFPDLQLITDFDLSLMQQSNGCVSPDRGGERYCTRISTTPGPSLRDVGDGPTLNDIS